METAMDGLDLSLYIYHNHNTNTNNKNNIDVCFFCMWVMWCGSSWWGGTKQKQDPRNVHTNNHSTINVWRGNCRLTVFGWWIVFEINETQQQQQQQQTAPTIQSIPPINESEAEMPEQQHHYHGVVEIKNGCRRHRRRRPSTPFHDKGKQSTTTIILVLPPQGLVAEYSSDPNRIHSLLLLRNSYSYVIKLVHVPKSKCTITMHVLQYILPSHHQCHGRHGWWITSPAEWVLITMKKQRQCSSSWSGDWIRT